MKKILLFCSVVLFSQILLAQSPQKLNYQAVVRTSTGTAVATATPVKLRFTIHDVSNTGASVYTETITTTANQFGLVNVEIGTNSSLTGVNWASGAKFLQVETDVNNTGSFTDMGTSQLLSVPYALYALNSNTGPQGATGADGAVGATGPAGANGAGATGPTGADGSNGTNGSDGTTGAQGATGNNGPTGPQGATGNNGLDGVTGATGTAGQDGVDGLPGATGATGPAGSGATGATGAAGNDGQPGVTGPTGPAGVDGLAGATGATGAGVAGPIGPTGPGGADGSGDPAGSITAFAGGIAPAGWLICDGSAVSRTTYANLFTVMGTTWGVGDGVNTFNIPDLRGRFLRGFDSGAGRDPDAASRVASNTGGNTGDNVGTVEGDNYKSHNHAITDPGHIHHSMNTDIVRNTGGYGTGIGTGGLGPNQITMASNTTGITINNAGGNETRPVNVSVNFIIKY